MTSREKINRILKEKHMSVYDLSKLSKVGVITIYEAISDRTQFQPRTVKRLAEVLKCFPEDLTDDVDLSAIPTFGGRIRACRRHQAMTSTELAELVGVHTNTIELIERGKTMPSLLTAKRIADCLDESLDDLTGGLR